MEFIEFLSANALKELELANKELVTMVANVDNVGKKMKNISTPSGSDSAIKSLTDQYKHQEKVIQSLQNQLQKLTEKQNQNTLSAKQMEAQSIKESNARNSLNKQREQSIKQLEREEQKIAVASNYYNKLQTELNKLNFAYQDLATRQQMGATLSKVEAERMNYLSGRIKTLDTTLKGVDGAMGKYQRNVGNYSGSFNPLSNSINQLSREMPAFANSVQTGFMAISNNLPIFFDAMQGIIAQNKELQAQGKPTQSLFKQLISSVFSFGTALSVGVTLLTIYGKEIVNWVSSLMAGSDALKELNENQEAFNKSKKEGRKESVAEQTELDKNVKTMRNSTLSYEKRKIALDNLRNQYPLYFKNLSDEEMMNGNIRKEYHKLNLALEQRATLTRATEANVKNKQRLLDLQDELKATNLLIIAKKAEKEEAVKASMETTYNYRQQELRSNRAVNAISDYTKALKDKERIEKDIVAFQTVIGRNDKLINELKGQQIELEGNLNTEKGKTNKERQKKIELQKKEIEADKYSVVWFEKNISLLEQQHKMMSFANPMRKQVISQLGLLKMAYELLYGAKKKDNEETKKELEYGTIAFYENEIKLIREKQQLTKDNERYSSLQRDIDFYQVLIDRIKGVNKALEEGKAPDYSKYFQGFVDDFGSNSGFSQIIDIMSDKIEGFGENAQVTALAVSEAFQQAFNTISEMSNANYENMYRNLEQQRDVAILFAGESTTAREEIERQYEERRRRIQRQQAESQKRLAMFNIVTDTAQAILATFAKSGFPAGVPLAIAMGAIGAVQLAMVASQPIPAFEKGGIHEGGLMLVNDGKGSNYQEKVVTPDGKVIEPKGRNVVMNAPKGTQIFTHDQWLNNILLSNGIEPTNQTIVKGGISKEEMRDVMSQFANKDSYHFSIDEGGINKTIMRGASKTNILNSRLRIKSNNV
jgi:hypothetical protein